MAVTRLNEWKENRLRSDEVMILESIKARIDEYYTSIWWKGTYLEFAEVCIIKLVKDNIEMIINASGRNIEKYIGDGGRFKEFMAVKRENPDCLLLFQVSSYYEAYYKDAEVVHEVMDQDDFYDCQDIIFKIPISQSEDLINKLAEHGLGVVISPKETISVQSDKAEI